MKKQKTLIIKSFAFALLLLFLLLFWQFLTVSDAEIEANATEILTKYFEEKSIAVKIE